MTAFAIIVDFQLQPGALAEFRRLMEVNARTSGETEPGCRQFDVLQPQGGGDRIMLYEIYEDEAAFADHMRSAHFLEFDAASAPLVIGKSIIRCDIVCEGSAGRKGTA